jgi:hypothetical protein
MSCSRLAETETSFGTLRGRDPRPVKVGHQPEASLAWQYDREGVLQCDVAFEAGDCDDEPEDAEGRPGPGFYVQWEFAGGGAGASLTGPFPTLDEARRTFRRAQAPCDGW